MEILGVHINVMACVLIVFVIWCAFAANRMNKRKDNTFEILDLFMENGAISKAAVVMMGAFALTTWMMVTLTIENKLTEAYLGIYVGAWIAPVVVRLITGAPSNPNKSRIYGSDQPENQNNSDPSDQK